MDVEELRPEGGGPRPSKSVRGGWWSLALMGAGAFWLANFLISLTPMAAAYRSALSIPYLPMLVEAAVGGLIVGCAMAFPLARFPERIPGTGPLGKALVLGLGALVLLTVLLDGPSKLRSDLVDPGRWLLVSTLINTIRILALTLAMGLVARRRTGPTDPHRMTEGEAKS